jgi:hypothetical protein
MNLNLMRKNLISTIVLIGTLYFSCSKSSQPGPKDGGSTSNIKIELVSGNNQTDTIGRQMQTPIVVKVTKDGTVQKDYVVKFVASGCNDDLTYSSSTKADGTTDYLWRLAGDVGQQTLKMIVLDSQNKRLDSVTAVCNALAPGKGWHYSACTYPFGFYVTSICKLSSGRLFTALDGGNAYLRYSDDNGRSWNSVKSLGNTHRFQYVMSTQADEVFAVASDGTYYSKDAGQTWASLSIQEFNSKQITGMVSAPSGKLLVTTTYDPLYISPDKGKTWTKIPSAALVFPNSSSNGGDFADPSEDMDGNLYVVGKQTDAVFQSKDGGKSWSVPTPNEMDNSFYVGPNNWFYKYVRSGLPVGLYISKNSGATYSKLFSVPVDFCDNMSVQNDGNFYLYGFQRGIYQSVGIGNTVQLVYDAEYQYPAMAYVLAKNNSLVAASQTSGFIRYYQQ